MPERGRMDVSGRASVISVGTGGEKIKITLLTRELL